MKSIGSDCKASRSFTFNHVLHAATVVSIGVFIAAKFILGGQAPAQRATPQTAGGVVGGERYLTHVTTDKPIYRTGEKVYVRGVVLYADTHSPMTSPQSSGGTVSFEIKGPKGDTVASGVSAMIDSTVGFSWDIRASQP